ncbi:MAG: class II aldolase/adducin family protein [Propionivibrio sp.]|uniref:class II aldolase/adducin family protein n=1 Tax=Propionivibrio sp. TaxID=2212460 RepID=UPI001A38FDFE|nr:class II aldolase/adducin family protein [Propionivibrio sp.]MBL8413862.1 class II aldolase/adducin family protein [Propionivibrio sp.]
MPELRRKLIDTARRMAASGLNTGTAGNLSVRADAPGENGAGNGFLITPSGMDYALLQPEDIVFMRLDGTYTGQRKPSSEWRFHRDLYAARPEAGAVLHAHSPFATSLACLRRDIPAFHYMIARFGGDSLRCAHYATFGTQALSDAALVAMAGRRACLLANHGMLVFGHDLDQALALGSELETLCEQYWRACQLGAPVLLDAAEMATVLEKFGRYGQQA